MFGDLRHRRLTDDGRCSCGYPGRLGETFDRHVDRAVAAEETIRDDLDEMGAAAVADYVVAYIDSALSVVTEQRDAALALAQGHEIGCGTADDFRCDCRRGDIRVALGGDR